MLSLGGLRTESLHTLDVSEVRLPKKGNFWTLSYAFTQVCDVWDHVSCKCGLTAQASQVAGSIWREDGSELLCGAHGCLCLGFPLQYWGEMLPASASPPGTERPSGTPSASLAV